MRLCTGGFGFRRLWKCSGIKDIFHRAAESISDAQQQLQIYFYMTMLNITQVSLADTDTLCQLPLADLTGSAQEFDVVSELL